MRFLVDELLQALARGIARLTGPFCCDCSCGDCAAHGHTCTRPLFGPVHRFPLPYPPETEDLV